MTDGSPEAMRAALDLNGPTFAHAILTTDAVGILRPVYDRFTEGFDTADLREARSLLEELA